MATTQPYDPQNPVRIVSAAALFDGHDAAINVMRRILQASGAEVIHLGHNRSVAEVVNAAIQEDAQGIALSSYQGGHVEYFTYMRQMLDELGAGHIRIYGGGGGVIVQREIDQLHDAGIDRIFSPEDGRELGLQGMINEILKGCDYDVTATEAGNEGWLPLARKITLTELKRRVPVGTRPAASGVGTSPAASSSEMPDRAGPVRTADSTGAVPTVTPVLGITGPGGSGKSSLTDELVRRFVGEFPEFRAAIVSVDPTRRKTGGALLGDRIRVNTLKNPRVYMRSLATRNSGEELSSEINEVVDVLRGGGFDLIIVETAGIGQGDSAITEIADLSLYVMTAEYGAPSQLEKIEMLDYADFVAINKFSRRGSADALRDVRKQYQRNRTLFGVNPASLPVFGTNAAQFNDGGVNALYAHIVKAINTRFDVGWESGYSADDTRTSDAGEYIIAPSRERYLSEITAACREYRRWAAEQATIARDLDALRRAIHVMGGEENAGWEAYPSLDSGTGAVARGNSSEQLGNSATGDGARATESNAATEDLKTEFNARLPRLDARSLAILREWDAWNANYENEHFTYQVRGRDVTVPNYVETLSETQLRKVSRPRYRDAGDRLLWRLTENVPGEFPYTSGTFPFKREREDPTRMFAGEGPAARTNARFHYLAAGQPAARLSTAFDSITLYGEDPGERPDIYGKIGESGVSIFTVEEAERLYAGFDLVNPTTSVSMTINGPAPTILAFFMNTAVRQQVRRYLKDLGKLDITSEQVLQPDSMRGAQWADVRALIDDADYERIRAATLAQVRGTVQADILKEDQAQNTCIFSTEFSLRVMGDVQQFFIDHDVRNFYSVSISGYHIAEAGANPIHQLAYTLSNGFTFVEYYRSRGMNIDEFARNLSFFFSNGMDAEYSVIGRVARRIWSVAMARLYGAEARSQMLKYHIQTSGRSLHAMEIEFNDIRTTLQALLAIFDNAQSLHTNAYDEAITTPTEESVRRAMAVQLIINREFGLVFSENSTQGSFIIEELTDLVEEAVLAEFDRLSERGGVLGAMERQYQRGQIQDDSLKYERLKHSGELPLIGVNTFLPSSGGFSAADPGSGAGPSASGSKEAGTGARPTAIKEIAMTRTSYEEKDACIARLRDFEARHQSTAADALRRLQEVAKSGGNVFAELMETVQHCSLGQITHALYEVGGEYRRNI
jgi:methylmalonyl-CoA mutase